MSIFIDFDEIYGNLLNETIHDNHTVFVVDPKTLPCEIQPLGVTPAVVLGLINIVIFLLAVPGNVLVGWVIVTSRQALTTSDIYLFHLTIADALMALTIPFWASTVIQGWVFGDFMCKIISLVFEANFYTSILFLACISIERYLVIVHTSDPLKRQQKMCSRLLCAAVWALGWALALPALFNDAIKLGPDSERMICSETFDIGSSSSWRFATRGFRHIFGFLLPLVIMVTCYSITITRLLRTRGFQKHRAMRVIIAVVIAFLLCWTPYHFTLMVDTLMRGDLIPFDCAMRRSVNKAIVITNSLALLHSCINPVLYAFVGEKFKSRMKLLVQRKVRQDGRSSSRFSRSTSQSSLGQGAIL
ncbi:C-X-C chemokine receptor type 2-like [Neosynchiropus ocellatus]